MLIGLNVKAIISKLAVMVTVALGFQWLSVFNGFTGFNGFDNIIGFNGYNDFNGFKGFSGCI